MGTPEEGLLGRLAARRRQAMLEESPEEALLSRLRAGSAEEETPEEWFLARQRALRPRRPRGVLEHLTRALTVGEAATAGGAREVGLRPEFPGLTFLRDPRAFVRGAGRGIRAGYDWTQATRELEGPGTLTPEWQIAAAGLARGILYDPLTYVGLGLAGKGLRLGARVVGLEKLAPVAKLARLGRRLGEVGEIEREARLLGEGEALVTTELAARAAKVDAQVSGIQRAAEDAMSAVYRAEGAAGTKELRESVRQARLARRGMRRATQGARRAEAEARRYGARAAPSRQKLARVEAQVAELEARGGPLVLETPAQIREEAGPLLEVLEEMARGAGAAGPVEVLRPVRSATRGLRLRKVGRTIGYDLAQSEELARAAGFGDDVEAFGRRLYELASEGGGGELRFGFRGRVRAFAESDMKFTGREARAAARALRDEVGRRSAAATEAGRQAKGLAREIAAAKAELAPTPAQRVYAKLAARRGAEAERLRGIAQEALRRSDDLIIAVEHQVGPVTKLAEGRAGLPGALLKKAQAAAERGAIPQAHRAARRAVLHGLRELERTAGPELAGEVRGVLRELQERAARVTERAVQAGYLTRRGAEKWGDFYLWRGFDRWLNPEELIERLRAVEPELAAELERANAARVAWAPVRGLPAALRRRRELLTREVLEALGELPVSQRLLIGERLAGRGAAEAYRVRALSRRFGLTLEELGRLPAKEQGTWTVVAPGGRFGELVERPAIPKWLAAHLGLPAPGAGWENRIARWHSWALPATPGELQGPVYDAVSLWKWAHAPGNLPTQCRNSVTNALMTYLVAKVPAHAVPAYMAKGLHAVLTRSPEFRKALATHAGFSATFSRAELALGRRALVPGNWQSSIGKIARGLETGGRGVLHGGSRLYEISEQSAKMAVFLYHTERGMSAADAARLAVRAIFDYGDVSRVTNWLRRSGVAPFITFPVKATKALVPAMLEEPGRFATLAKTIRAPGYAAYGGEREAERAALPEWDKGRLMRLPMKTSQGETLYLDVGYYLPWGPWAEGLSLMPLDLAPMPRIVEDVARNRSSFTGRPVYDEDMPWEQQAAAIADFVGEQLGPGWIVRGLPRLREAAEGRARYRWGAPAEAPSVGRTAAAELVGLRTRAIVPEREMRIHHADLERRRRRLLGNIRGAERRAAVGEITEAQRERIVAGARQELTRLQEEFRARRDAYVEAQAAGGGER